MKTLLACLAIVLSLLSAVRAENLMRQEWMVDGIVREALVHRPAKTDGAPVIFGFHGHGGTMRYAARRFRLHELWPEAIVVYPQGLPTRTPRDPDGGRAGWNMLPTAGNRDLRFFDALLATAKTEWKGDSRRVYAMGHSNGGGFVYALWGTRPDTFAALAPVAAGGGRLLRAAKPCPLLQIGGKNDPIVAFSTQERGVEAARRVNGGAAPVEFIVHDGGHEVPPGAPEKIVAFFKKHIRPEGALTH